MKIDGSFVRDVTTDADDAAIVQAIIGIGENLCVEIVAEGVETAEQAEFLKQHGCPLVQGYYFARPQALEVFLGNLPRFGSAGGDNQASPAVTE